MNMPGIDPRADAKVHLARARWFLNNAGAAAAPDIFSAFISSSVYSARAAVECFLHWQKVGLVDGSFDEVKGEFEARIRHFQTIEYLRLHDFHRGRVEYAPGLHYSIGPFSLKGGPQPNTHSAVVFGPEGVKIESRNGAKTKADRPISISGVSAYSSSSDKMLPIVVILNEYLTDLDRVLPLIGQRFKGISESKQK